MQCMVCGSVLKAKQTRQVVNTLHRIRECGECGLRCTTVEMPMVCSAEARRKAALKHMITGARGKEVPEWALKAVQAMSESGLTMRQAAAEHGRSEQALRQALANKEQAERRKLKNREWGRRRRAAMTPEQKATEKAKASARGEAKARGVSPEVVYREWGLTA